MKTMIITLKLTVVNIEGGPAVDLAVSVKGRVYEPRLTFLSTDIPIRSE